MAPTDWVDLYHRAGDDLARAVEAFDALDDEAINDDFNCFLPHVRAAAEASGLDPAEHVRRLQRHRAQQALEDKIKEAELARATADTWGGDVRRWRDGSTQDPKVRQIAGSMFSTPSEAVAYLKLRDSDAPADQARAVEMASKFGTRFRKLEEVRAGDLAALRRELEAHAGAERRGDPDPQGRRGMRITELRNRIHSLEAELVDLRAGRKIAELLPAAAS